MMDKCGQLNVDHSSDLTTINDDYDDDDMTMHVSEREICIF